jgi:hypothetical protein
MANLDPAFIERLRQSGIRIDKDGEFQHEGEPVRHEGLRQALFRWLDRLPDGRVVLRLDERRFAYVEVDDTPLVVRGARVDGDRVLLTLSDGAEEPLAPETLTVDGAGVMRCTVRAGKLEARLSTAAAAALAEIIDDSVAPPALVLGERRWAIRLR